MLWKLSKDYDVEVNNEGEWKYIDMKISITYLSYMLGTSRECISRVMKVLQEMNAISWNQRKLYVKEVE